MRTILRSFIAFLRCSKKTLLLIMIVAIASVTSGTTISIMLSKTSNLTLPSFGTVKTIGVEVYGDQKRENKIETIDWDEIWVGSSKRVTVYIQSVSNYQVTINLNVTDWDPNNLSEYMTVSWDYNGAILNPSEIIQVTLTLSVNDSPSLVNYLINENVQNFTFDIYIIAS